MRLIEIFNNDWRFEREEDTPDAANPAFDDGAWRAVTLPHDWSIEGPFDERWASATGFLPGGIGWYRKTFTVPRTAASGRVYLHFDGIYCNSEVWINGHFLGRRPNGYISFRYDLTPYLNHGDGSNVVAVRVDHAKFGDSRWYTGSGIYRNVHLISTPSVHIGLWGVTVTTPTVTLSRADVHVAVEIENHTDRDAAWTVEHALMNAAGHVVAGSHLREAVLVVEDPLLWSPDSPYLYSLRTRLSQDGVVIDEETTPVGIRSIRFDANEGFFLNDRNLKLKGICLHDDAGALGVAVPPKVWERRLHFLKAAGVNAIRAAHNPHMPEFYDICDRLGFLVQDEAFDEWELGKNKWIAGWNIGEPGKDGYHEAFAEWAERDLIDMIRRDRNHPSVIMWSIGNEIDYPNDPYSHEALDVGTNPQIYGRGFNPEVPHSDQLAAIARRLVAVAKSVDITRPVTAALSAALISVETGFGAALDVVGYNYQEYRYAEDHARFPEWVLYGSENGMRLDFWQAVADNPYISGQFLWTGIDYLGEAGTWPARSNTAGLLDLAGFPKPEYYFRQSLWASEPMVYLGTRDVPESEEAVGLWGQVKARPTWSGTPGRLIRATCFTNCAEAELFINDRSVGVKHTSPGNPTLWWDVAYEPGTARVHARNAGVAAASAELTTTGAPAGIVAGSDAAHLKADGIDLAHVSVRVVDADGVAIPDAVADITWTIDGPARLLGLESGDPESHESYQANHRRTYQGRLLGYIQATHRDGAVTVSLSAPGLEGTTVALRVG